MRFVLFIHNVFFLFTVDSILQFFSLHTVEGVKLCKSFMEKMLKLHSVIELMLELKMSFSVV